jgi:hypothetical protein
MLMEDQFEIGKNKGRRTEKTSSTIQINNNWMLGQANINESLQCDKVKFFYCFERPSNLGTGHWVHTRIVV